MLAGCLLTITLSSFAQIKLTPFKDLKTNKFGYKDASSNIVIAPIYLSAYSFYDGYATVESADKKNGVINQTGKVIIPLVYDFILSKFSNGLIGVGLKNNDGFTLKCGYLDINGKIVIPFDYSSSNTFASGLGIVCKNDKYGCIDVKNKVIIDFKYEYIDGFYNDWSSARRKANGKVIYGYINKSGVEIIPFEYEDCESAEYFSASGLLNVKKNGLWGYIDKNNKTIIPFEYTSSSSFYSKTGTVKVKKKDGTSIKIDVNGNVQK